ncbi:MAG: SDR family oxidoreductase, partial [Candidatus Adiutrix sp.]|nr:SDR family oxidoreductase [Candidatus Adiutrix sp.]
MISFQAKDIFLVTGASSGIGAGVALTFNELGATVIAGGRDPAKLAVVESKVARPEFFHPEPKDLTEDLEGLSAWVAALKNKYGKLRGLIHCAGLTLTRPLQTTDYQTAKKLFDINYFAALALARGFCDRRANAGAGSSLTFIASYAAHRPPRGLAAYAGSKAALVATAQAIARETAPRELRVNCISPAFV